MSDFFGKRGRRRSPPIPSRIEVELREEIRFYLEMRAEELEREGLGHDEAWRTALEAFGDPEATLGQAIREHPDAQAGGGGLEILSSLRQDLRYAVRSFLREPGFFAAAVGTLAVGIGATTAIYSVVNGVLMRPLPFPAPEELVAIHTRWTAESGYEWDRYPVGSPEYFDYLEQNRSMRSVGAVSTERLSFRPADGDPRMVTAGVVSPSMFETLQVPPVLGRTLLEDDGGADPAPVVVLAHGFWVREFGGDSTVVGRTLELGWENQGNDVSSVVVGVMPEGFAFPDPDVELWAPLLLDPARTWRGGHWFSMIARLSPGTSLDEAQAEMGALMTRWRAEYPDHHAGHFLYVTPLLDDLVADVRPTLMLLFGAVALVLLIACVNVASLLLARGSYRRGQIAVRAALGAGRFRLVRQLLIEATALAVVGGALGLLLATTGVDALLALEGGDLPRAGEAIIDGRVLAFTGLAVVSTTLLFGALPAHHAVSASLSQVSSSVGGRARPARDRLQLRKALVVGEVALSLLLMIGAGLMAHSFWRILHQDPGFRTERLLTVLLTFPEARYSPGQKVDFMTRLAERVQGMPGVEGAGIASRPPLLTDLSQTRFTIEGQPELRAGDEGPTGSLVTVSRDLLDVLGVRAVEGRLFDETDDVDSPPVALIDEEMARRYWPGEDPIGRRIRFGATDSDMRTIVGITTPVKFDGLTIQAPTFYEPERQAVRLTRFHLGTLALVVRTVGEPLEFAGPVRDAVRELDPALPVLDIRTVDDLVTSSVAGPRFILTLLGLFAVVALGLGAVGVFGVVTQGVAQRTNEIGIRRALGARADEVRAMVVGQGMSLVAVGMFLGLGVTLTLHRVLRGFLFEVSTTDPWTYGIAALTVAAVAVAATVLPASRATRIDPVEALRAE